MRIRSFGILFAPMALLACAPDPTPVGTTRESILNGDPLSNADSVNSFAVSIRHKLAPNADVPIGSGVLIKPNVVLTARHVPLGEQLNDLTVVLGNAAVEKRANVLEFRPFPGLAKSDTENSTGADLGILILDRNLPGFLPSIDCDPFAFVIEHCVSGIIHQQPNPKKRPTAKVGVTNEADFKVISDSIGNDDLQFSPNVPFLFGDTQAPVDGDSGMGCTNPGTGLLQVIQHDVNDPPDHDIRHLTAGATILAPYCSWINKTARPETKAALEIDLDGDNQLDLVALSQIAGDSYVVDIERSSQGDVTFPITLPGLSTVSAAAIGSFGGSRPSLAMVSEGALSTAAFNGGPQPTVMGAPSSDYIMLTPASLNGDASDDLVAQRSDGQLDAFLGGSSGLSFSSTIHPIPMKIDSDPLVDYAWLQNDSIHVFSSRGGSHLLKLSDPITLTLGKPGTFRRLSGDNRAVQDLVVLGQNTLIWCDSTLFGLECNPAIDAPFATGRHATDFDVQDVSGDGLDDLVVTYSDAPQRTFLAKPNGFKSSPGRSFREIVPADIDADGNLDAVALDDKNGDIFVSAIDPDGNEVGPFDTGVPFVEPVLALAGNFNDDGNALPTALAFNDAPFADVVISSGGVLFTLTSNGDGTFAQQTLSSLGEITDLLVDDENNDGIDDVVATLDDGSTSVFTGSTTGLGAADNFTGLPTPNSDDGKMLLLSGLGVDTVGATEARFRISVAEDADAAALDHLTVQIFDGDNGGLNQFDKETKVLKTCYRLSADPCGDGNSGSCSGGSTSPTEIVTLSSDSFGDNVWDKLYQGPHSPAASIAGDGNPPYNYELRVYLSNDCSALPSAGDTIAVATADAFKVRSNGLLSMPAGEFSLVGSDSDGDFGIPGQSYMTDTNYDGVFELPIAVGSSATEIQLKESDADDTTDSTPGVSIGANADIQYRLLDPSGNAATLVGAEDTSSTTLVTNPSGNNDGVADLDVETRIHTITSPGSGTWIWRWENVMAANAFHVFTPFGSPTTHEVLGARRARVTVTSAQQPYFWQTDATTLAKALPIVLGHKLPDGTLEGSSVEVTTTTQANAILNNAGKTLAAELQRQLLVTKLNQVRANGKGEDLRGALVYGTTTSVRHTLADADAAVAGSDLFATDDKSQRLVTLLGSVNLGEVTYLQPGVPFPAQPMADLDGDGIVDMKDNCPAVANPLQEDADDNRIGDACNVMPIVDCVLNRTPDTFTAFFDYENPLSFRSIPLGLRNQVLRSSGTTASVEPNEFGAGQQAAFSADFASSESLTWTLEGQTVVADGTSALCSGKELATGEAAPQTALFGTESVKVGDHVTVRAGRELPSILSGGEVEVGGDAEVGHVFAGGRALLAAHSAVRGTLVTAQTVQRVGDAAVLGQQRERAVVPGHSIAWWVDFGASARAAVELAPNEPRKLTPGAYGDVVVPAGAVLTLAPGQYQFASLSVASSAVLSIPGGNVVVHVATGLSHHGETRVASDGGLVLGYFGADEAVIDASLRATVVAPNASVVLGAARNSVYTGSFFARSIEVRPSSIVEYEAPR